ncbi:MAG: hypothetical protein J0H85_11555 [Sediminibacterium magnilacihabitans]|nr:hypothetical protein [Sediminibacterium magnilacihabitans]
MKTIVIFLFALFAISAALSQNDSLKKFSYPLLGFSTDSSKFSPAGGTCFFIRNNGKIYLITARHVITGCGIATNRNEYPEQFTVINNINGVPSFISVNVKGAKDLFPCPDTLLNDPDIFAMEVIGETTSRLNSVEQFIKPPFRQTDCIDMYGFPGVDYFKYPEAFVVPEVAHQHIERENTIIYDRNADSTQQTVDSSNYIVVNKNLNIATTLKGFSGSPVFLKELNSNKIRLLGVFAEFGFDTKNLNYKYWKLPKIGYAYRKSNDVSINYTGISNE